MWQSRKSGATYSDIRKTDSGLNRLLDTLKWLGYKKEEIVISEQNKVWLPDKKVDGKRKKRQRKDKIINGKNN
jgi:hypothetical protein